MKFRLFPVKVAYMAPDVEQVSQDEFRSSSEYKPRSSVWNIVARWENEAIFSAKSFGQDLKMFEIVGVEEPINIKAIIDITRQ